MAKKSFSQDEIKWILSVDAQGAQGEVQKYSSRIQQLTTSVKEYEAANKSTNEYIKKQEKELKKLEREDKKNSSEYRSLSKKIQEAKLNVEQNTKAITANNRAISDQNNKLKEVIRTMKIEDMTMSQLRSRAKQLQSQLDRTSRSLSPESYAKLQTELNRVRSRMDQLTVSSKSLNDTAGKSTSILRGGLMVLAGNLMTKALQYFKQLINHAKEWVAESIKMAASAEGVTTAFNKLGKKDLLKNLRQETKFLLNDFELMKAAVNADNFSIPVEHLGKLLKFAQQRAQETGQSVEYMTESLILGTGRKSPLKLDNLGISLQRIQDEVKKTGDFTTAVIKIVNEELEKQGTLALTSADKAQQATVRWQNAQVKLGSQLLAVKDIFSQLSSATAIWFTDMVENKMPQLMKWMQDVINKLIEIYNSSMLVRVAIDMWHFTFVAFAEISVAALKSIGDNIILLLDLAKALLTLDFKEGAKAWLKYSQNVSLNMKAAFKSMVKAVKDDVKTINEEIETIDITSPPSGETGVPGITPGGVEPMGGDPSVVSDKLSLIDQQLQAEINLLKQRRLEGLLIEVEYNRKVEELTIASYRKKLDIIELEEGQRVGIEGQMYDALIAQQNTADAEMLKSLQDEKERELKIIETSRQFKLERLQDEESDRQLYAIRAAEIETSAAEMRMAVISQFSETLRDSEFQNGENRTKAIEENGKQILDAEQKTLRERDELQRRFLRTSASFDRMYVIKDWEQRRQEQLDLLSRYRQEDLISEETYLIAVNSVNKKYDDEKFKARQQAGLMSIQAQATAELENLRFLHEQKLLSEQEYEESVFRLRMKYAAQYASQSADMLGQASEIVSNLMTAETENVEARYNAEIAAAGDNAEKVEALEQEKAQKKLDIEKKYADVQFAITAAEIIANTAMGVMQAFAQLGPIAGAIAGGIVSLVGTSQLLVAMAQRKKVKSMTLAGGGSSGESPVTGRVTMRGEGYAEGGYNTDYSVGGYTASAGKYEQTGWIPVHGGEYVVASDEMARPDVAEKVRSIEQIRRRRTSANSLPAGYAEGGYNRPSNTDNNRQTASAVADREAMNNLARIMQRIVDGDITVNYGITEMEAKQREKNQTETKFTKLS